MDTIIVIGGGASGIVSAISAKTKNNKVIVLERNSNCLKKLLMTGNGKCNYFNDDQSFDKYYSIDSSIINSIITDNNMDLVIDFFNKLGVVYKKKNGYYYPFSNQASTIKEILLGEALRLGVLIECDSLVTDICVKENGFEVYVNDKNIFCNKLIISTGSKAYPKTGSDGMGYSFLSKLGHSIIKPLPALVPLICDFKYAKEWAGIRSDVIISLYEDDCFIKEESGEIQLTDYGISGICTFNLSHVITRGLNDGKSEIVKINFVPFIDGDVFEWVDNYCLGFPDKNICECLNGFLNNKLVSVILKSCGISFDKKYCDLKNFEKKQLVECLYNFSLKICDVKSFDFSQVCNGGVRLSEINPLTFESKIVNNLYITGELLDLNGLCGGYNLTVAWLSGLLAGKSAGDISVEN